MNPILIFEGDFIYVNDWSDAYLTEDFIWEYLSQFANEKDRCEVILEYQDSHILIYQFLNPEGESWKFIQSR